MKYIEDQHCRAFIARLEQYHPNIAAIIYHIKNEQHGPQRLGAGVKKGMPDFCYPQKTNDFGALYLEFKAPKGRLSDDQKDMHELLTEAGNKVVVCRSWEEGVVACLDYLKS
jgi:hypothetical protein